MPKLSIGFMLLADEAYGVGYIVNCAHFIFIPIKSSGTCILPNRQHGRPVLFEKAHVRKVRAGSTSPDSRDPL